MRIYYNNYATCLSVGYIIFTSCIVFNTVTIEAASPTAQENVNTSNDSVAVEQISRVGDREDTEIRLPSIDEHQLGVTKWWELRDARTLYDRSRELLDQGWPLQAREFIAAASSSVKKHYGDESCEYAKCLNLLARINYRLEEYEQAEATLEAAQAIMAFHSDEDYWHGERLGIEGNLANTKLKLKQYRSAESLFREIQGELGKADNPEGYGIVVVALGNLYLEMGDYSQAEKYIKEGYESITTHMKESEAAYIGAVVALGKLHLHKKEYAECKEELLHALKLQQEHNPKNYLQYADIAYYLVDFHIAQGQLQEAEQLLENISTAKGNCLGKEHPLVLKVNARLAELRSAKK
jgi:tetratricopeptide (TPR) repeat protein